MDFSFVSAAVACAVLERISGLEPKSKTIAPRYLKLVTVPSFCHFLLSLSLDAIGAVCHPFCLLRTVTILCFVQVSFDTSKAFSSCSSSEHLCPRQNADW